jgi:tetratricopeptide (TPR) repeat protein
MKKAFIILSLFWGFTTWSQNPEEANLPTDDLGSVSDEFQNYFFKALAQTAINNNAKAVNELERCLEIDASKMVVHFWLGKNYKALVQYKKAEMAYEKALDYSDANQKSLVHQHLLDLFVETKQTEKAIAQALELLPYKPQVQQELVNLYVINNEISKALELLDKIEEEQGYADYNDQLRLNIYLSTQQTNLAVTYFSNRINQNQKDLNAYLALLEVYKYTNNYKAILTLVKQAKSQLVILDQLLPYQALAYIQLNQPENAKVSAKQVVKSPLLDETKKTKLIEAYRDYVRRQPELESDLIDVLNTAITTEENEASKVELALFYKDKDPQKAYAYFKEALNNKPNDFKLLKEVISLGLQLGHFKAALKYTDVALSVFPTQPVFYYAKAVAHVEQQQFNTALSQLDLGFSLLIGSSQLKANYHQLYAQIYNQLDQPEKAKFHESQLNQ